MNNHWYITAVTITYKLICLNTQILRSGGQSWSVTGLVIVCTRRSLSAHRPRLPLEAETEPATDPPTSLRAEVQLDPDSDSATATRLKGTDDCKQRQGMVETRTVSRG